MATAPTSTNTARAHGLREVLGAALPSHDPEAVAAAVARIDAVASGVEVSPGWDRKVFAGWQTSAEGIRLIRRAVRVGLHAAGLPAAGEAFDAAFKYVASHY